MGIFSWLSRKRGNDRGTEPKIGKLTAYRCSRSGDMAGSFYSEEIGGYDGTHVKIVVTGAEWHGEKPKSAGYVADASVLTELEAIFRKYSMDQWVRQKISDIFVCDGPSTSYGFTFGADYFGFSSQLFPGKYGEGTAELSETVRRYIAEAQKTDNPELDNGSGKND